MPFAGERASRIGHIPTVNNEKVAQALGRWEVTVAPPPSEVIDPLVVPLDELPLVAPVENLLFSITVDGSDTEVVATREYPSVKVGYLRVAGSMVNLDEYRSLRAERFVDPARLRNAYNSYAFDAALPGARLIKPGMSGVDTWRSEVDAFLQNTRFDDEDSRTIADALLQMLAGAGQSAGPVQLGVCPTPACSANAKKGDELLVTKAGGICPQCQTRLYLADVLRTHDEYKPEGSNTTPLTRLMNMAERLMTLCYMDHFYTKARFDVLEQTLFVTDGPLAIHGTTAPLSRNLIAYHAGVARGASAAGKAGPFLVGIEKSGAFVEHAAMIADSLPERSIMRLTNKYINRIQGLPESHRYGTDEFYGRRFIYKTSTGSTLVITVPPTPGVSPYEASEAAESFDGYPTLRVVCEVLDGLRTRMYENAVMPLALAHSTASLPLGVGHSVLQMMTQERLKLPNRTIRSEPVFTTPRR